MITGLDFFYDAQIRRFLEQIVRAFSGYQYRTGRREGVDPQLRMVPCRMASTDRMVGHILRNLSENTLLTVPMITVSHTGLKPNRNLLQNPSHVDTRQVVERAIDPDTNTYTSERGTSYTVRRLMPRPFTMTVNVDLWTSNTEQKHQLAEQMLTVMMPDFPIQNSDNALDWSARTLFELQDVNWSSRTIPIGTEDEIDIMTLEFKMEFWLSPPAEVTQQKVIEQIITNVYEGRTTDDIDNENLLTRHITTPGNHSLRVRNGELTLLGPKGAEHRDDGSVYRWDELLNLYGKLRPGVTQIRLKTNPEAIEDWSHDLIGTVQYDSTRPNVLLWQLDPDTLPANTRQPILGVINPVEVYPGNVLPAAANGQRYLIIHDVGPSNAWGNLSAHANDIIEYSNGNWSVSFHPEIRGAAEYVLNLNSGRQLRWNGWEWVLSIDGDYAAGFWRLSM